MTVNNRQSATRYELNLGAKLYKARWLFEHPEKDYSLMYAPDWPGMPVLVPRDAMLVCDSFVGGEQVGGVVSKMIASGSDFIQTISIINSLVDRGFLRGELDLDRFRPKPPHISKKSMNIWLHINNYCNLACSYCFVDHTRQHMETETIEATVEQIGRTVRTHGVDDVLVKFAGGEPTLAIAQMEQFHGLLRNELENTGAFLHWTILTNGTNTSKRFLDFVEKSGATISISLDGYGADHDKYRVYRAATGPTTEAQHPRGSWKVIEHNIGVLLARGIRPYINAMVGPKTSSGLPALAEWIYDHGMIGTIHVIRNIDDSWSGGPERLPAYQDYCHQLAADFERMFAVLENEKFRIQLPRWMEIAELHFDSPAPDLCCGIGTDHIVIKHDGTVASCPMTVHEGNVRPQGDLFAAAKQTFDARPDWRADAPCLACQWFKVCASACPVANQRIKGHPFSQSPLCQFWKYVIPRYARFYGTKLLQAKELGVPPLWSGFSVR